MSDYRLVIRWSNNWKKRLDKYASLAKRKSSAYARLIIEEHIEQLEKKKNKVVVTVHADSGTRSYEINF
jgi:predicted DNA-binding protein